MKKWYLLLIQLIVIYALATAQITIKSIPVSYNTSLNTKIPVIEIPNIIPKLPITIDKVPTQAGYTLPISTELSNMGLWEQSGNNFVWRLEIVVPDANTLNLYFNKINLLVGERLYIYDPQNRITLGAFTSSNNGSFMCTDFVPGDRIVIEFNSYKQYKHLPFSIHEAGVLFSNNVYNERGFGDSGPCEVHVNCIEGENWQNEKDGVARILVKQSQQTFWCTGSLINNTKNDGTPYFLTANHCGEYADSSDYAQWLFFFNFESKDCEQPLFEPELNTLSGASLLANSPFGTNNGSDFKLLLLKDSIPSEYRPYFNGWDRTGEASTSGVTIHHPQGDLKMISTYTTPLVSTKYNNQNEDPNGKYWKVYWDETITNHGVTEGGSSGSPIFNNEGNIVGALTGGSASCSFLDKPDYYGKFSYSWGTVSQDSTSQLNYWLDPNETGITTLKGSSFDSTVIFADFTAEPTTIVIGKSVFFTNTSNGNIDAYNWYFEGGYPEVSELKEPGSINYSDAGKYDVRLVISSADGIDTLTRKDFIKVLPNLSPNPCNGTVELAFGDTIPDDIIDKIRIFDAIGRETGFRGIERVENHLIIDMASKTQGIYYLKVSATEINTTYKVVVIGY